jgi:parallel beta-helix repeat protein
MRANAKGKITLLILIGLAVFMAGSPIITSGIPLQSGAELHDSFTPAYTAHDAILLDGNAEMIAQATAESWLGNGTAAAPYEITGYYFYDVTHSVEIRNIDLHWTFTDNEIDGPANSSVWCGIEVSNSRNGYVANNLIHNRFRGIWLIDIFEVTITDNIIEDNLFNGIECEGFINGCLISDNTIRRNEGSGIRTITAVDSEISGNDISDCFGLGIQVMTDTTGCQITNNRIDDVVASGINLGYSTSVSIMHNQIINASGESVYVRGSHDIEIFNNSIYDGGDDGIAVTNCAFGTIHNNTIDGTDGIGISVVSGGNSTFRFNHIEDATDYGLETGVNAEDMMITRNVFINNVGTSQVCDEGANNIFIYNYYDDWTSPDADSDQIVDTPYGLDGGTGNEDPYPLAAPNVVPPVTEEPTTLPGGNEGQIPLELVTIAGGAVIVVIIGVLFVKKRA